MPTVKSGGLPEAVEKLIDADDLQTVLLAIEVICSEKAAHIRHNWQDNLTAKRWDKAARVVGRAARDVSGV